MAWSTRALAELVGTTMNTIRHHHRLGLLEEPERRYNGYKQYGARDLVRLPCIGRLADLGVPLSRIGEVDGNIAPDVLSQVDTELAANIERLPRTRSDIAAILRDSASADTSAGFEPVASGLSGLDSSMIHIYPQLHDEDAMADLRRMVEADTDPIGHDIDVVQPDADEANRRNLAEKLAPILARHLVDHPWLSDPAADLSKSEHVTRQTFIDAVKELYDIAQLDALRRRRMVVIAVGQRRLG